MSVVSLGESNVSVNQIIDMYYSPIYAVEASFATVNNQVKGNRLDQSFLPVGNLHKQRASN